MCDLLKKKSRFEFEHMFRLTHITDKNILFSVELLPIIVSGMSGASSLKKISGNLKCSVLYRKLTMGKNHDHFA